MAMSADGAPGVRPFELATQRLLLQLMAGEAEAPAAWLSADGRAVGRAPELRPDWVRFEVLLAGMAIGEVGLLFQDGEPTEIGYRIAPEHRRRGYATEALRALLVLARAAFGESELAAEAAEDNMPSHLTLLRLGFVDDGSAGVRWSARRGAYVNYRRYRLSLAA
jgi:RimJ/RimL family protein N-acetyltransferase